MKLFDKDKNGSYRLVREALDNEILKAKFDNQPIYVLSKSINSDIVLYVHYNKVGKKVYRINKQKVSFNNNKGTFCDNISDDIINKIRNKNGEC